MLYKSMHIVISTPPHISPVSYILTLPLLSHLLLPVEEITVFCHFLVDDLMSDIICKNDKHVVTLYNVILSNRTAGIMLHLSYIFY